MDTTNVKVWAPGPALDARIFKHGALPSRKLLRMPSSPALVLVTATTSLRDGEACSREVEAYKRALLDVGLFPAVLPPVEPALAVAALDAAAGLVLTGAGGEDVDPQSYDEPLHPATGLTNAARDAYEIALFRAAAERHLPTLALCRGIQIANVAVGGSLLQDIPSQRPVNSHPTSGSRSERVHAVDLESDSRLREILGADRVTVNSFHHQAIARVASSIRVVGTSPDGIVEAIEWRDPTWWMVGVQWHPEDLLATHEDWDRRLFAAFSEEVSRRGGSASLAG